MASGHANITMFAPIIKATEQPDAGAKGKPTEPAAGSVTSSPSAADGLTPTADNVEAAPKVNRTITVRQARTHLSLAVAVLEGLAAPNDIEPDQRDAFAELQQTVASLERRLAQVEGDLDTALAQNERLRSEVIAVLPLWKRAGERIVMSAATTIGAGIGSATLYVAWLVAGDLLNTLGALPDPGVAT